MRAAHLRTLYGDAQAAVHDSCCQPLPPTRCTRQCPPPALRVPFCSMQWKVCKNSVGFPG